jgi:hypothetical protein
MPIILISADTENNNLIDFRNMDRQIDVILESTDNRSRTISEYIVSNNIVINRIATEKLNAPSESETNEDVYIRFQAVVNMIRSMNINSAMIISHTNVINTWQPNTIRNEWEIIEM